MNTIGILLDSSILQREAKGIKTYERLWYYHLYGKKLGLQPVFFHPGQVRFASGTVRGYRFSGKKLVRCTMPIPEVIHNRVLSGRKKTNQVIRRLQKIRNVYNGIAVRNKHKVHLLLRRNPALWPYLPATRPYTRKTLLAFLDQYQVIYVKRVIGYIGQGVARIERHPDRYRWTSAGQQVWLSKEALLKKVAQWVRGRKFLVQQGIPLAKFGGQTFDIRVSVQKGETRQWDITGMVAKVANPQNKLSNLAQGGVAKPLDAVLSKLFSENEMKLVKERVAAACLAIAEQYETFFPSLADLGMDVGIDREGNPYLIEINVRDQRYSFFKAGEMEMFQNTYVRPLAYGKSLFHKRPVSRNITRANGYN